MAMIDEINRLEKRVKELELAAGKLVGLLTATKDNQDRYQLHPKKGYAVEAHVAADELRRLLPTQGAVPTTSQQGSEQ